MVENKELNIQEFSDSKTELESLPQYLLLELTRTCNLSCIMCQHDNDKFAHKGEHMPKELLDKVFLSRFFQAASMVDIRGYGESLVLPNILEIIHKIGSAGKKIKVVTNLSFKRNDVLDALAKYNAIIDVSIDSPDAEVLRKIRTGSNPSLIFQNLKYLSNKYIEFHGSVDNLNVQCTIQKPSLPSIPDFCVLLKESGFENIKIYEVYSDDAEISLNGLAKEVDECYQKLQTECRNHNINLIVLKKIGTMPDNPDLDKNCIHPWSYMTINYNGLVGFCDDLTCGEVFDKYALGNLHLNTLEEIWNSEKWVELRKAPKKHEACRICWKNKYPNFENHFTSQTN